MTHEGPPLETLLHRLAETPAEFLDEPKIGSKGRVHVDSVVADLLRLHGAAPTPPDMEAFTGKDASQDRNRLAVTLLLTWLAADDWFLKRQLSAGTLLPLLEGTARELAEQTVAGAFLTDPDRSEEITRITLARLDFRPEGESPAQAQDRLTSLSATERARVIAAARAAELRARAIREALAKKAAEESADKYTRE
ncbi:hypothetical protein [Verrucomicrobium spinosum]|uniref:hypothetical protein n=2 Tax=Verrucomicrobium spinosum TaxID=2736 RepID=UPI000174600B|nr:hypothetical protein [Verrucomicrobium spinosum]